MPPGQIHLLRIPTPFAVGDVNCYLVDDDPLTLVDTGPNSGTAYVTLDRLLAEHGRRVEDIERIVVTHQHLDHLGLAQIVADRSRAEVVCIEPLVPWLAEYDERMEDEDRFAVRVMLHHGVKPDVTSALRAVTRQTRQWGAPVTGAIGIADGAVLEFASRSWRVLHRPGHSPSDTLFHDESSGELIVGDHLLARVSSNPVISRPLDGDESTRPRALCDYIESMKRTRDLELTILLPGHGEPIEDHRSLIDERLQVHERRADKIARILGGRELTAHEIAGEMWGDVAITQAYLTLSEVVGHLDVLIAEGRASERDDDEVARFTAR